MASRVLVAADNRGGRVKFAVLNGLRVAPEKGLIGAVCPICKQPVFARCGEIRLPHWAHKSVIDCDPWKESETQWHRDWKDLFGDMQEQVHENGGVRHLADVKTPDGTIVEFRHSVINDEGKRTRAAFFGKQMLWVVDCVNRPNVLARFMDNKYTLLLEHISGYEVFSTEEPAKCLPRSWINCNRFVVFDFGEKEVWCLFPRKRDRDRAIFMCLKKNDFVAAVKDGYEKFRERCVDVWRKVKAKEASKTRYDDWQRSLAMSKRIELPVGPVDQVAQVAPLRAEEPSPAAICAANARRESKPEPTQEIWPENFDRTVVLALTVDAVSGWLIANGRISELETESIVDGEANATGCCALHCSTRCSSPELYWAKRRIRDEHGGDVLSDVPQDYELKGMAGDFVGVVEYHVEERPSGRVRVHLRKFRKLNDHFSHRQPRECIWRLTPDLQSRFAASTPQDSVDAAAPSAGDVT